jgi:hypothetical protein
VVEVEGGVSRIRAAQEVVEVEGEAAEFADVISVINSTQYFRTNRTVYGRTVY